MIDKEVDMTEKLLVDHDYDGKAEITKDGKRRGLCSAVTLLIFISSVLALIAVSVLKMYFFSCVSSQFVENCREGRCAIISRLTVLNMTASDRFLKKYLGNIKMGRRYANLRTIFISQSDAILMKNIFAYFLSFCQRYGISVIVRDIPVKEGCTMPYASIKPDDLHDILQNNINGVMFIGNETATCNMKDVSSSLLLWEMALSRNENMTSVLPEKKMLYEVQAHFGYNQEYKDDYVVMSTMKYPTLGNVSLVISIIRVNPVSGTELQNVMKNLARFESTSSVYLLPEASAVEKDGQSFVYYFYMLASNRSFIFHLESVLDLRSSLNIAFTRFSQLCEVVSFTSLQKVELIKSVLPSTIVLQAENGKKMYLLFNPTDKDLNVIPGLQLPIGLAIHQCSIDVEAFDCDKGWNITAGTWSVPSYSIQVIKYGVE